MAPESERAKMVLSAYCRDCKKNFWLTVDSDRFLRWRGGEGHIQNMLPELSEGERELLITNTCGECFDKLFEEPETEEYEV